MKSNSKVLIVLAMVAMLILSACTQIQVTTQEQSTDLTVVASIYPAYEIAQNIIQNKGQVSSLVPIGSEPHSYEPSPRQIADVASADLFVTIGLEFESLEDDVATTLPETAKVIKLSEYVDVMEFEEEHHNEEHEEVEAHDDHGHEEETDSHGHDHDEEHEEEDHMEAFVPADSHSEDHDDHDHGAYDPHIWGSPQNMITMTYAVLDQIKQLDPQNVAYYEANAQSYITNLQALDQEFQTTLATCQTKDIIVNHAAFGYLAEEYGLNQHTIAGLSPEIEPSPQTLANLIDEAKELGVSHIFFEELASDKVAQTIATEVGAQVLQLNPAGGAMPGETYQSIMQENLKNLKVALNCNESAAN